MIPPTQNHRQLANWINAQQLVDDRGRRVVARIERVTTNTDTKVAGTRFRRIGRGRRGLVLEIFARVFVPHSEESIFRHESSETYRKHSEARAWVEQNLRRAP